MSKIGIGIDITKSGASVKGNAEAAAMVLDSFDRPAPAEGGLGSADTGQPWLVLSGSWSIRDESFAYNGTNGPAVVELDRLDCIVDVEVIKYGTTENEIVIRAVDGQNYLCAALGSDRVNIGKKVAGVKSIYVQEMISVNMETYPATAVRNHFEAIIAGSNIKVSVNGVQYFDFEIPAADVDTFNQMRFGLGQSGAYFDNFRIRA